MKNKSFLPLTEQILMIAVFALASALCLWCFFTANEISRRHSMTDRAVIMAQNTAEALKSAGGDMPAAFGDDGEADGEAWCLYRDSDGDAADAPDGDGYLVRVTPEDAGDALLGGALISVSGDGEELFSLRVCWQEVSAE